MDKRKDATAKIKNLVFYSPSREELQRCSTSRDQKSQKFLRDDSSTKFQTVIESSRITNDEILSKRDQLSQTQIIQAHKEVLPDTKTVVNDNRNITPQKSMSRLQKGQQYLPTLARSSMREGDNSMGSPQMARDSSTNELIESTLLKENKSELTRIYKNAREFQDLKLTKEKERLKITRDSDRIKAAMNKLSDDMAYTMTHNVQNIKTDVSHYFNEKRSRSPEQNVTLPEIKDQFKTKFHKLLQDINDDAKLSPEKNNVLAVTSRGESNLLNNTLKSSRFLTCEVSPLKRNQVFNTLHKDIRSVKTPMMKTRRDAEQTLNNKSQTSTSFMQQYPKAPGHSSEFLDDNVLQGLRKELPNLFSSNPSNRQEVLVLGNWMINTIKDVQEDEQLSKKDRFYRADEVYNLCFNELIRQVSFDCIERAELLMKIWKAYISLSEDIINDFREREKQVITKAKQECDKLREIHQKLLEDKDKDIERIKEELNIKDDIIKEKNERIERFNDDQSENINQARQASEALIKIQKLYLSLKQEHKDVNFKFEKIKKRLAAEDLADLDKNNDIPSDSSSDDEERRDYMFGNRQTKIIKRETKETTTSDLMEWAKNGTEVPGVSTQTNLALMHKRYNPILRGNDVLDDILREKAAKKKLLREGELMANMTGLSTNEIVEKRRASHLVETRRSSILSEIEEKKLFRSGSSKIKDVVSKSQVVDSVLNEKINYKINVFGEQQPSQGLQGSHSARLVPKIDISGRRESIMSTRSDRIIRNNNQDNQPDTDRSPRENMNNGTDDSDNDSLVDCKDNKGNHKDIYETNDVLESAKIESRKVDRKASKKSKIKKRNSAKEEYFGTSDKSEKLVIKREDSASKGVLASTNSPVRIKKAGTGSVSLTKKRNSRKGTEGEESIDPKQEQDDNPQTISAFKSKVKVSIGKRGNKQDPESRMVLNNNSNVDNHNSLAGATEEFKAALRQTKPALDPASQVLRAKKDDLAQKGLTLEMTKSLTVNPNSGKPDKPYTLNIPLLSPITMREFPNGDASSKSSAFDLKGASLRLDDSPKEKSDGTSFTSRESRPVKSVANAIKAIKKIALLKGADNKSKALNGIAETLAQVDEDNEAAAQLIESQEQKIIRFTNLYKIEKKKQEDLRALNRELERQVIEDGVIIETFQRLVEELGLASEMTDMQKRKVETLVSVMEIRSKNLEAIDEMKPKLDPAFIGSIVQGIKIAAESPRRRLFEDQFTLSSLLPESKYKGDFMVDVVLSPGQKFLLAEKLNNPINATLAKVKRDLQTKKTKVNAVMPIKSLLKQITIFYTEKVHQGKDNPMLKEQDMGIFVYKQFINTYGLGKYAVQKFVKFVTSLKRHLNINRVNNFAKMVNVLDTGSNYSLVEVRQYLHGLEFFMYHSTAGIHFPNPDHQKAHYIPFSRALEYLRYYTEKHGQEEDLHIFKKELEKLRIVDPSRINVSGLIDIDIFLEKMVARHKAYVAKAEEALLTGFISADFLREKKIKFANFLVLHKAIEGDRNEDKKLEEAFVSYCDVLDDEHLALSKEKFFTLSYDYNIFSKQKINAYLGLKDDIEFEKKFEMFRNKWDEEQETIRNNIEKCQAVLPHEVVTKWKSILEIIGQDIDKNESHIRKSILVRHKILTTDIANNISVGSG